ncbi:hypothetical protein IV102_07280 [bacterium]|nr:hypothetical protein [bacterium]
MIHSQMSGPSQVYSPTIRPHAENSVSQRSDPHTGKSPSVVRGVLAQLTFLPRVAIMGAGHAMRGFGMEAMNRQDEFDRGPSFSDKVGRMFDDLKVSNRFNGV